MRVWLLHLTSYARVAASASPQVSTRAGNVAVAMASSGMLTFADAGSHAVSLPLSYSLVTRLSEVPKAGVRELNFTSLKKGCESTGFVFKPVPSARAHLRGAGSHSCRLQLKLSHPQWGCPCKKTRECRVSCFKELKI